MAQFSFVGFLLVFSSYFLIQGFASDSSLPSSTSTASSTSNTLSLQEEEHHQHCLSLGFNSLTLSCSLCTKFDNILHDKLLSKECEDCCTYNEQDNEEYYELVVLEIDKKFLSRDEQLSKFIKEFNEEDENANQLILRHKYMAMPTLVMYKKSNDEEPSRILSIYAWSIDDIRDFLKSHMINGH